MKLLLIFAAVIALRLPFLHQAIQGDDVYYLYGAEHAQVDPLHPKHTTYVFRGDVVDMRGHPHGPVNPWILGGLLALTGGEGELPFHLAYIVFSLIAAGAMFSIAQRFCERPLLATLLFLAVPAFVINGTSLEADLPFLAFWMASIALFLKATEDDSGAALLGSAAAASLAALTAYQAVFLIPILGWYLWDRRRTWFLGWIALLAAPAAIVLWQLWERASSGALPVAVLAGYLQAYGFEALSAKARSAAALLIHLCWMISPVITVAAVRRAVWRWDFLTRWIVIFFLGAVAIFFAGSARYLLPVAAPLAILAVRWTSPRVVWIGFALQMALSLTLAAANSQQWDGYRSFAQSLAQDAATKRVWVNGEWGLRHYLEAEGALPLTKATRLQPGDIVVTSELSASVPVTAPTAPFASRDISPLLPFRLISLQGSSAYSSSGRGLWPFEISSAPADRVHADVVLDRKAELSFLDPRDPKTKGQWLSGIYSEGGWMGAQASVLLKAPAKPSALRVELFIPEAAAARHIRMLANDQLIAEETFDKPGAYALAAPFSTSADQVTVTIEVDKTHRVPGDERDLGVVLTGVGFR